MGLRPLVLLTSSAHHQCRRALPALGLRGASHHHLPHERRRAQNRHPHAGRGIATGSAAAGNAPRNRSAADIRDASHAFKPKCEAATLCVELSLGEGEGQHEGRTEEKEAEFRNTSV
uniref:Uncharacterized protein n=1 Tax=Physcomitrium patens TaxID=3218 RepID=A0A2K1LBG7_PHYPA|nr:hypothetical protein PHYPA_001789 [Physcomitrium patens]